MVSQKFSIAKILILILSFIAFVVCSFPSHAVNSNILYRADYENYELMFYKGNFTVPMNSNDKRYSSISFVFQDPENIVTFIHNDNNINMSCYFVNLSGNKVVYSRVFHPRDGSADVVQNLSLANYNTGPLCAYNYVDSSLYTFVNDYTSYMLACRNFASSGLLENYKPSQIVDISLNRNDTNFGLQNVNADCVDNNLTVSWSMPFSYPDNALTMPLLVDLLIEDTETGEGAIYYYPATESMYERPAICDVSDLTFSFDVGNIKDIPEYFKIKSVSLTPYYIQHLEYLDMDITYKGQTSHVFLNYVGHDEKPIYSAPVVQLPPDTEIIEEDMPTSIFGAITNFFSGFFNNFGTMLKNLFIPSESQLVVLLQEMQEYFSAKLGFLWFPFDFAIEIVTAFLDGEQNTMFIVPPITINILDGITLYEGGTFDIDTVGIFGYVRFFSSIVLSCFTFELALHKWDEFMKGGVAT